MILTVFYLSPAVKMWANRPLYVFEKTRVLCHILSEYNVTNVGIKSKIVVFGTQNEQN